MTAWTRSRTPSLRRNRRHVRLDRRLAQVELLRELGVREAAGEQTQDLALAAGQLVELVARRHGRAREALDEASRGGRPEERVAGGDDPDRVDELGGLDVLEQEAAGAGLHGGVDVFVEVEGGEHEDAGAGAALDEPTSRLAAELEIGALLEDHAEAAADERLVVGHENADAHVAATSGRRAATLKPPPGAGPAASEPPKTLTRSRIPISPWPAAVPLLPPARPSSRISTSSAA